jgi:hypothetical protein
MSREKLHTQQLLNDYNEKYSIRDLEKKYKIHRLTIKRIIKENNIVYRTRSLSQQKIKINSNYFEKIDTANKAYFLGFIYADGNIYKNHIKIDINKKDEHLLHMFLKELNSEHKVYRYKDNVSINISNEKIKNDLNRLGVYSQKTTNIKFPNLEQVPDELIRHFLRGYFDGDGSIQMHNYGHPTWRFVVMAPDLFVNEIKNILISECQFACSILQDKRILVDMKTLYLSRSVRPANISQLKKVYEYFYSDASLFLVRKKEIFENILEESKKYPDYNVRNPVYFNNTKYVSIRAAAKANNLSYSKMRKLLYEK